MTKILITGGTGFVGHYLTELVRREQPTAELVVTSHRSEDAGGADYRVVRLDLTDPAATASLLREFRPEQIYHLASLASVPQSFQEPAKVLANNFAVTLNLLEGVRQQVPTARLLLVSSADLYDHRDPAPIDESRGLAPTNPYAASKATQDLMAQAYSRSFGLEVIVVRPFNHLGPGQREGFVVADFASKIAQAEQDETKRVIKVGNLESARDFTDVRDMVRAYYLLMNRAPAGEIYNAGSGQAVKIATVLDQLVALAQAPVTIETDPAKLRPVDTPVIVAEASKLRQLGWAPIIPLEQTLADILAAWRAKISHHKG